MYLLTVATKYYLVSEHWVARQLPVKLARTEAPWQCQSVSESVTISDSESESETPRVSE